MVKQNIGIINALLRITCGLTFLSLLGKKKSNQGGSVLLTIMAAMKVAEGIVRYCPVTDFVTRTAGDEDGRKEKEIEKRIARAIDGAESE